MPQMSRIRPGRASLVSMAAMSVARMATHAAKPVQLFGAEEERCVLCGQSGHCSADCRRGAVCTQTAPIPMTQTVVGAA